MINGVLTERTVKEVVPILKTNSDGLKKALEELVKQYKTKQDDMEKWKVRATLTWSPIYKMLTGSNRRRTMSRSFSNPSRRSSIVLAVKV
jgi:predicted phage tail protein